LDPFGYILGSILGFILHPEWIQNGSTMDPKMDTKMNPK